MMSNQHKRNIQKNKTKQPVFFGVVGGFLCLISIIVVLIGVAQGADNIISLLTIIGSGIGILVSGLILIGINMMICILIDIRAIARYKDS